MQNFVRGKGSYAPFLPGGLEPAIKLDGGMDDERDLDGEEDEETGWKTRAPGLRRGLKLDGGESLINIRKIGVLMLECSGRIFGRDAGLAIDSA